MSCKVSDFGLSRELADDNPESEYQTQVKPPIVTSGEVHGVAFYLQAPIKL